MPVLYRASFGYLLRHPWQLALALLGICIGVAVIVAVDLANASSRKAFLLSMETLNGAATHQVIGGPRGVEESLYVRLRVGEGIRDIAPVVDGSVEAGGRALSVLGIDMFAEGTFRSYPSHDGPAQGLDEAVVRSLLLEPGAVLMTATTATELGVTAGDAVTVTAAGRTHQAPVVGILGGEDGRLDNLLITDIATAQSWFDRQGYLSRIDVRLDDPEAVSRLQALLPSGAELIDADTRSRATTEMTAAFMTNLTAMSLLALLVGIFLIYNSVGFAVLQRRGLIGVLRALGLTRRQTVALIVVEGAGLGVVGALLGLAAGIWLGDRLLVLVSQSINDLYFRVTVTDVAIAPLSLAKGFSAGVGATLVAAAGPAIEASGYEPQLALRRSALEARAGRLLPGLTLAGLAAAALAALLLRVSGTNLVAGLTALFLMILGVALCIPVVVRTLARLAAPAANAAGGTIARLAVTGIGASLSRTGVAIVALAVAVSATVGVSIMVDSFRGAVVDWLEGTLRADIYLGVRDGSLESGLVEEIRRLPGVAESSTSRRVTLEAPAGRTRLIVLDMASRSYAGTRLLDAEPEAAWRAFEQDGAVLVSEPYGFRNGVGAGDSVVLNAARGSRAFDVVATFRSYDATAGAVLMSRSTYDRHWNDPAVDSIGLYLAAGAAPADVSAAIRALARDRQAVEIRSNRDLRDVSLDIFDRTFVITDVLYWLAVGVAVVGILGAMLALQLERARELAVLRALGVTPGQLGGLVTLQSGLIGALSGLAAIPLGLLMAWLLIEVINRRAFGWQMDVSIDPGILAGALGLAVGSAIGAGLYPAYRAARSRPALAMREE